MQSTNLKARRSALERNHEAVSQAPYPRTHWTIPFSASALIIGRHHLAHAHNSLTLDLYAFDNPLHQRP